MKILIVEDDSDLRGTLCRTFTREGFHIESASSFSEAKAFLETQAQTVDLVISDVNLGDGNGVDLLAVLKEMAPNISLILMTGYGTIRSAVEAVKRGAFQYLTKPVQIEELINISRQALGMLGKNPSVARAQPMLPGIKKFEIERSIVGESPQIRQLFDLIHKVADTDSTVLITGESGTGKELVARALHLSSPRAEGAFVAINCGAIPRDLLESELFGHVKGSFTGAHTNREGKVLAARGGTLFLDEIGDMPVELQVKLLRFLQTKTIEPVGSSKSIKVDVRILAATNVNLEEMVRKRKFREDLFYRLNVIPIPIPPLRHRREDIPILLDYFLKKFSREKRRPAEEFSPEALEVLSRYDWPGNVRELENLVERLVVLVSGSVIELCDLPEAARQDVDVASSETKIEAPPLGVNLPEMMSTLEDDMIKRALQATGGNKQRASQMLGLNRTTLIEKMKKRGIPLSFPHQTH